MGKTVEEQENANSENSTIEDSNEVNTTAGEIKNESEETDSTKEEAQSSSDSKEVEEVDNLNTTTNASTENKTVTETKKEITFVKPTEGEIICEFAKDNLIYSETLKEWITHTAIDIKADKTSVIRSAADGVVKSIVKDPRYGLTIVIEHDEHFQTVYSNLLTSEFVVEGEKVEKGQSIGTVGNSASFEIVDEPHLHFEIIKDGENVDPSIYLK